MKRSHLGNISHTSVSKNKLSFKFKKYVKKLWYNYQAKKWLPILNKDHAIDCPVEIFLQMSRTLQNTGDTIAANQIINRGAIVYPNNIYLALEAANIEISSNNFDRSIKILRKLIDTKENECPIKAFHNLIDSYFRKKDYPNAELIARKGLTNFPNDFNLSLTLGKALISNGLNRQAIKCLNTLLESKKGHPSCDSVYGLISSAYCSEGLFERAEQILEIGASEHPNSHKIQEAFSKLKKLKGLALNTKENDLLEVDKNLATKSDELSNLVLDDNILVIPSPIKILVILPAGRLGASGRYIQTLSVSLIRLGCQVMVISEGNSPVTMCGVMWDYFEFEGSRVSNRLRKKVIDFGPHIIYESGVRSRAQRAALELLILTNAHFAMQSEDDDQQIYEVAYGKDAAAHLISIDQPLLKVEEISSFLTNHDWKLSLNIFLNPSFDRWIEPISRALCYRLASLHTAIWYPFEKRLAGEYGVPTLVVPPVAAPGDFERLELLPEERNNILGYYGINNNQIVFFIGGALYAFSDEYSLFLDALNLAYQKTGSSIALIVSSSRSKLPIIKITKERLCKEIEFIDIGKANDVAYTQLLKACDIVCSPGVPDTFNKYRLPSRLVKAMAMSKPILTCRCGFGESLDHGVNAFLTEGIDPSDWANVIIMALDSQKRQSVGEKGRLFAEEHFNSDRVAAALKKKFEDMMSYPPRRLVDSISQLVNDIVV